jgi:hypothetical protein
VLDLTTPRTLAARTFGIESHGRVIMNAWMHRAALLAVSGPADWSQRCDRRRAHRNPACPPEAACGAARAKVPREARIALEPALMHEMPARPQRLSWLRGCARGVLTRSWLPQWANGEMVNCCRGRCLCIRMLWRLMVQPKWLAYQHWATQMAGRIREIESHQPSISY